MIIRICEDTGCRTQLSRHNPTSYCWEHRRAPRRITMELAGAVVQRDDPYAMNYDPDAEVETWRPHMCSDTFIKGMERRVLTPEDTEAYASGEWMG